MNRFMLGCETCEDWFHPRCIGLTIQLVKSWQSEGKRFFCSRCRGWVGTMQCSERAEKQKESGESLGDTPLEAEPVDTTAAPAPTRKSARPVKRRAQDNTEPPPSPPPRPSPSAPKRSGGSAKAAKGKKEADAGAEGKRKRRAVDMSDYLVEAAASSVRCLCLPCWGRSKSDGLGRFRAMIYFSFVYVMW